MTFARVPIVPLPQPWCGHCGRDLAHGHLACVCEDMTPDQRAEDLRDLRQSVERVREYATRMHDMHAPLEPRGAIAAMATNILAAIDGDAPKEPK